MNEKNLEYLSNQLKYTGFGEGLQDKLKENIVKQPAEFVLYHQAEFGKDSVAATLHFRKSPETDMYFFNRYNMLLKSEQHPDPIKQAFYISSKEDNITFKEAYNVMSGRAVQKTLTNKVGEKAEAWVQLDFKELDKQGNFKMRSFYPSYGYDLPKLLDTLPLKELNTPESRNTLLQSLQRGNRQSVTIEADGSAKRFYLEAVPQYKSVNWYDEKQTRIKRPELQENGVAKAEVQKESLQKGAQEKSSNRMEDEQQSEKRSKRKGQHI